MVGHGHGIANVAAAEQAAIKRLRKELKLMTDEHDILKKSAAYFASTPSEIRLYQVTEWAVPVQCLCEWLEVHPSGYYA